MRPFIGYVVLGSVLCGVVGLGVTKAGATMRANVKAGDTGTNAASPVGEGNVETVFGLGVRKVNVTPTVVFLQPTAANANSPLVVSATANVAATELRLFVDGVKYTQQAGSSFNASVPLSPGTHRVAVQAVTPAGVVAKAVKYVTISSSTVSTLANTVQNIQESSDWLTCGACGNSSGNSSQANYSMTRGITTPAIDNTSTSAEFSISGSTPYTNGYWYIRDPAIATPVQSIIYDFYLYVPAATGDSPQAIEFECQQTVNGYVYNFAWQANYKAKVWKTFDYVNRKWVPTTIPFSGFTTDTWHHITAQSHADGTTTVHDSLTVDGVTNVVNIVSGAKYTGSTSKAVTNAFQLDMNGQATGYSVYIDKMSLSYQ